DIVEAALVFAVGAGEDEGEGLVLAAEAAADREIEIERAAMLVRRLIAIADRAFDKGVIGPGGRARGELDGAAEPLRIMVRHAGLGDDQAVDRAGRDGVELDR